MLKDMTLQDKSNGYQSHAATFIRARDPASGSFENGLASSLKTPQYLTSAAATGFQFRRSC